MLSIWKAWFVLRPLFAPESHVSTDSLVSRHRPDILIGPEITFGAGCWLLVGPGERVDGRPVSADAFTGHIWPLAEHLTACDCVRWGTKAFCHRTAPPWIALLQTQHLLLNVAFVHMSRTAVFIHSAQIGRKYWTSKLLSGAIMKRRSNNIYTTYTFLRDSKWASAGWITLF